MSLHAVLLRAINVGGHNKIPMADLRVLLDDLGYTDVVTYVQSGNVVCDRDSSASAVTKSIRAGIADRFGHDVHVIVRSAHELEQVVTNFPYGGHDPKRTGVVFLSRRFDGRLDCGGFAPDECTVDGSHVFVHCPTGFADTKLTNAWVEKQTGLTATRRNWNTVLRLAEMMRIR